MSIPVQMDQKTFRKIKRQLLKDQDIVCLDDKVAIAYNLVGYQLSIQGILVKARIISLNPKFRLEGSK